MTRINWWLIDRLSGLLEPGEYEAVRGDFAESGETGGQALLHLLGLVVRRQAAIWNESAPWLALVGLVVPVGVLLGRFSSGMQGSWLDWAGRQFMTLWGHGVRYETGMTLTDYIVRCVCGSLLLIFWAWSGGFILGSLLRRSAWVYAALTGLIWVVSRDLPLALFAFFSALPIPIVPFLLIAQTVLILIPCLWGVRRGIHLGTLGIGRAMLLALAIAALTLVLQVEDDRERVAFAVWSNGGVIDGRLVWTPRILPFAVIIWQFGFMFAATNWRRRLNRDV